MTAHDLRVTLATRLATARKRSGWTQVQIGEKSGIHPAAISHFEQCHRLPSLGNLRLLADALSVSMDYLVGRVDTP